MATVASPSSGVPSRSTYSCVRCADRKVKCDRQRPCSACVKHNADCVFKPPRPPQRRQKRVRDQVLTDRLRFYEALLQEQGIDPSKLPDTPESEQRHKSNYAPAVGPEELQLQTPSSLESEPSGSVNKTQVVHGQGRSKFLDNHLWTRVVEEFHDREDALDDSSNDASDLEASEDDFRFVLVNQSMSNVKSRHPLPECIHQLWQIFTENVDPLTKVVHVPSLRLAIQKAADNLETIPRSFEALMFAIYSAAVMSLKDDECRQRFNEPRKSLLSRYIAATKGALSRAKFMGTISLVVLQALVLHLFSVRDIYEPRAVWSLTGVAIRIAQTMGLERDGVSLGLPPFETEMRRRIWWLLKTHDFRAAELCGLAKFRDLDLGPDATKSPTNVNDDQLHPGMLSLPPESNTLTDAVFVALRSDLSNFAAGRVARFRQQGKDPSHFNLDASDDKAEMDKALREVEELLEVKYVRYCDPSQPLHLMAMLVARAAMNNVRFLWHHPRRWASIEQTPLSERQQIWEISLKLLEQHNMWQTSPQLKGFAWHAAYFLQWHVLIHVLDTLRANPLKLDAEKAWQRICNTYESNPDIILDTKKPIHIAVGNLCLKAYSAREAALQSGEIRPPPAPEFILQLRQQRELAKARRQVQDAKRSQVEDPVNHRQANNYGMEPRLEAGVTNLSDTLESTYLRQSTESHPPKFTQIRGAPEGDSFWLFNGFDDGQVGGSGDVMNMDLDFMLAQDHIMEENTTPATAWEQWDAWLADSNLIRPLRQQGT